MEKIRPEELEELIADEKYLVEGTTTICVLTLANGFRVTGTSGCMRADWFDAEVGREIARKRAIDELWPLEGYRRMWAWHDSHQ